MSEDRMTEQRRWTQREIAEIYTDNKVPARFPDSWVWVPAEDFDRLSHELDARIDELEKLRERVTEARQALTMFPFDRDHALAALEEPGRLAAMVDKAAARMGLSGNLRIKSDSLVVEAYEATVARICPNPACKDGRERVYSVLGSVMLDRPCPRCERDMCRCGHTRAQHYNGDAPGVIPICTENCPCEQFVAACPVRRNDEHETENEG